MPSKETRSPRRENFIDALYLGAAVFAVYVIAIGPIPAAGANNLPQIEEAARKLGALIRAQGAFQPAASSEVEDLRNLANSLTAPETQFPQQLARRGWNSTGGGGGIACFEAKNDSDLALDSAGRLRRMMLQKVTGLMPFDFYRIAMGSKERNDKLGRGELHLRQPRTGESAETFLKRVLINELSPQFPLLVEKLVTLIEAFPFSSWEAAGGLPRFPDLNPQEWNALVNPVKACVYTQMAIRYVNNSDGPAHRVHFVYDRDQLELMHRQSASEEEYQMRLSFLILHEMAYFLAEELGAKDSIQVADVVELVMFDDADVEEFKLHFFEPVFLSADRFNQAEAGLFGSAYEQLLAAEPLRTKAGFNRLVIYQAWIKMYGLENQWNGEQETSGCPNGICLSGGALLWWRLINSVDAASALTPVEAFMAYSPQLTIAKLIPSPEALVSLSVDPGPAIINACQHLDFSQNEWTSYKMTFSNDKVAVVPPDAAKILFDKIQQFCAPAP